MRLGLVWSCSLCSRKVYVFILICVILNITFLCFHVFEKELKSVKLSWISRSADRKWFIVKVIFQARRSIILWLQLSSVFALFYVFPWAFFKSNKETLRWFTAAPTRTSTINRSRQGTWKKSVSFFIALHIDFKSKQLASLWTTHIL